MTSADSCSQSPFPRPCLLPLLFMHIAPCSDPLPTQSRISGRGSAKSKRYILDRGIEPRSTA